MLQANDLLINQEIEITQRNCLAVIARNRADYGRLPACGQSIEKIATDTGFCGVSKGDWIVKGENGETYVVDDAFFQRTFTPFKAYPWELEKEEGRNYGC